MGIGTGATPRETVERRLTNLRTKPKRPNLDFPPSSSRKNLVPKLSKSFRVALRTRLSVLRTVRDVEDAVGHQKDHRRHSPRGGLQLTDRLGDCRRLIRVVPLLHR